MTKEELINKYPIIADDDLTAARKSIFSLIGQDDYADDRAHLIEYCNDTADINSEKYFYDMIKGVMFISTPDNTAYTTPDKLIYMNYPNERIVPMDKDRFRRWYFVYCHECMHQLWDTFAVAEEIKKKNGTCNHILLNIASDCVINEYLSKVANAGKLIPEEGITAENIKEQFGVEYNMKTDTQASLYNKLNKLAEDIKKEIIYKYGDDDQHQGGQGGQGSQAGSMKKKIDDAQEKLNNGDAAGAQKDIDAVRDELSKNAAGLSDAAKDKLEKGSTGDPQKDINDLKDIVDELAKNERDSTGKGGAGKNPGDILTREEIDAIRSEQEKTVKKYANSISGPLKDFLEKCRSSKRLEWGGLGVDVKKGSTHWNKKLMNVCDTYIKQRLNNMEKHYKSSYKRFKRGESAYSSSDFANGRIIKKGKEVIKDKIGFDMALYIDVSGSMGVGGVLGKVFDAAYDIVDSVKDRYGVHKLVDASKINTKAYVFTTNMREIKYGKKVAANGGTYSFNDLLDDIYKRNANAFLNIVITDGDFDDINENAVIKTLKDMDGLFVIVSNKPDGYFKDLVNTVKRSVGPKLTDIYTDENFTLN